MRWFRRKQTYSEDGPLGFSWEGEWFRILPDYGAGLFVVYDSDDLPIAAGGTVNEATVSAYTELQIIQRKIEDELKEMFQ
jgi:hypothetical protein